MRYFEQFSGSLVKKLTHIVGRFLFTQEVAASVAIQDLTYTAFVPGDAGNLISIEYIAGGTAGAEGVVVTGNKITVQIEDGVSTASEVKTAIENDTDADALVVVTVTGVGGDAQDVEAETFLTGGVDLALEKIEAPGFDLVRTDEGEFKAILEDNYASVLFAKLELNSPSNQDLLTQVADIQGREIDFRVLDTGSEDDPVTGSELLVKLILRNSGVRL